MKSKGLYIFILFMVGVVTYSFTQVKTGKPLASVHAGITINSSGSSSGHKMPGDSPFIRFHHGISESNVSVVSEYVPVIAVKPVSVVPEKFAGIIKYISSVYHKTPVSQVFLYSLPLRSPPVFS